MQASSGTINTSAHGFIYANQGSDFDIQIPFKVCSALLTSLLFQRKL